MHALLLWLREAFGWIVVSLSAGTLFAMRRGKVGFSAWVATLVKSLGVGMLVVPALLDVDWPPGYKVLAVAAIAYGADAVLYMLDSFWESAAKNPAGFGRSAIRWLAGRGGPPPTGDGRKDD